MSQWIKDTDGWKQTAGNVNPNELQKYVDSGYLSKNIVNCENVTQFTSNGDGTYSTDNTQGGTNLFENIFQDGKIYTFSCYIKNNGSANGRFRVFYKDGTTVDILGNTNTTYSYMTYTTTKNVDYVQLRFGASGSITFKQFQIVEGSTVTTYIPSNTELQSEINASPKEYNITLGGAVTSSSYFKVLVSGKFAQLIADVTYTTNSTAYSLDVIGTLPSEIKPFGTTNISFMGTYNLTDSAIKSIIINPNTKTINAQCGQTNQSKRLFLNITFLID